MKVYQVPRETYIRFKEKEIDEVLLFHKVDGMYSRCSTKEGHMIYIAVWAEVEVLDGKPEDWE